MVTDKVSFTPGEEEYDLTLTLSCKERELHFPLVKKSNGKQGKVHI